MSTLFRYFPSIHLYFPSIHLLLSNTGWFDRAVGEFFYGDPFSRLSSYYLLLMEAWLHLIDGEFLHHSLSWLAT